MSNPSLEQEFEIYASVVRENLAESKRSAMVSDLIQAVIAGKAAVDGLQALVAYTDEIQDTSKRSEFSKIVTELSLELAKNQILLAETLDENNKLKEQISACKTEINHLKNPDTKLTYSNGLYYAPNDEDPFCPGCYDNSRKRSRVNKLTGIRKRMGDYHCPVCSNTYGKLI